MSDGNDMADEMRKLIAEEKVRERKTTLMYLRRYRREYELKRDEAEEQRRQAGKAIEFYEREMHDLDVRIRIVENQI